MENTRTRRASAVFFCNFPPPYTGQTIGTELTRRLVEAEIELTCIDTSDGEIAMARSPWARLRRLLRFARQVGALRRRLATERPDVLYFVAAGAAVGHLRDVLTVLRCRPFVGRVVAHVRSGEFERNFRRRWHRALTRRAFSRVDTFVFQSRHLAGRVADDLDPAQIRIVPNAIDEPVRCSEAEIEKKLQRRSARGDLRVLYLANMIPQKGYLDLAEALAVLAETGLPVRADFVGTWLSAADEAAFGERLARMGIEGEVETRGPVHDRTEIKRMLLAADVLVLPTYYAVEAQPRSIIEALNAATPIVATRHASIPDYVHDGVNGRLVEPRAPRQIAAAVTELADPETWGRWAAAARQTYVRMFDPAAIQADLVAALVGDPDRRCGGGDGG